MEKDKGNKHPQRLISSESTLTSAEKLRIRRMTLNIFKKNYERFKKGEFKSIDLYKGDFPPLPSTPNDATWGQLKILLPSDFFISIEYEELFARFVKVFSRDLDDQDPEHGGGNEIPEPKTKRLASFIKENPGKELAYSYTSFPLESDFFTENRIEVKRYYEGLKAFRPLTEFCTAVSLPKF
jgi:hypothetical protein